MYIYHGARALSDFRKEKLIADIRRLQPAVKNIEAQYVHFVDAKKLSIAAQKQLKQLLDYGSPFSGQPKGELFLVTPRVGTISPWSSKATDIAKNCALTAVRRVERGVAYYIQSAKKINRQVVTALLHDRMTEAVLDSLEAAEVLFKESKPKPLVEVDILKEGKRVLASANHSMGLALSVEEIDYLYDAYKKLKRNPTDVELMMFAQVNSEHSRHKIFNAKWIVDGTEQEKSLFQMIKNTYKKSHKNILSAYSDNAAVLKGPIAERFFADPKDRIYRPHKELVHMDIKAETHNHPTAIAPNPGAGTGTGGEIRDEGTAGQGSKPKVGMAGYTVSNLNLPGAKRPWEKNYGKPGYMVSPLDIMIEAPLGASGYGNEYGKPTTLGYFRTYEQEVGDQMWGYHKPIMIAGGIGNIRDEHVDKKPVPSGSLIIQLGGPAMLIGLGGAAGSSMQSGQSSEKLDFASVQRANPEMQRRAQEVIDYCWSLGKDNPVLSIHDVGGGGLAVALPEIVHNAGLGAVFELRDVPNAEPGMAPMEIWCNESQERYVLAIAPKDLGKFKAICEKERCPFAVVGKATKEKRLLLHDSYFDSNPINLPIDVLFGNPPRMKRTFRSQRIRRKKLTVKDIDIVEAAESVLSLPAVGSKKFLITIGDRTVGGLVRRDQMVGPWQVPVSDVAVTATAITSQTGEAMALGERPTLALISAAASVRMAIGETITNITAADIGEISDIKLSANWMAAAGSPGQDQQLFEGVKTAGEEFCPALGITIPVGKDSLSMRTFWQEDSRQKSVVSPLSLVATAFAPVIDIAKTLTPELQNTDSRLILVDLGAGKNRLGGSALAQVYNQVGDQAPDIDPEILRNFFNLISKLKKDGLILAYHDRSDGGLFTTLCEMSFASRLGLDIQLGNLHGGTLQKLFNEELGAVIQIRKKDEAKVLSVLEKALGKHVYVIGSPRDGQKLIISQGAEIIYQNSRKELERLWADTSWRIQKLRDNPKLADQEYAAIADDEDPGLFAKENFQPSTKKYRAKPEVAILREQGVNGQVEMAAGFSLAGFDAVDVHLTDLSSGRVSLDDFRGLVACGGFSYGDVLGAGEGMAKSILFNSDLRQMFKNFFARPDTFSLGVCNGCQMFAALKGLIPGAGDWPRFVKNSSEQFEGRLVLTKIKDSPSVLLRGMAGWRLPIPTAHGEGRAEFSEPAMVKASLKNKLVTLQFVDNYGRVTESYPANPNGSPLGIAGLTSTDGRATIVMPHPERAFLTKQLSWHPAGWSNYSPWFKLFQNARDFVG